MSFSQSRSVLFSTFACAFTLAACSGGSDGSGNGAPPQTQNPNDAGPGGGDAGAPDADASTKPTIPPFQSSTPGAKARDDSMPAQPDLALLSSVFLQEPSGSQYYQQWFGEVMNHGHDILCYVQIDVSLLDAQGSVLTKLNAFASAAPYASTPPSTLTMPCLAPGATGTFYSNGFANGAIDTSSVATIAYKLGANVSNDAIPHPHAPQINAQIVFDTGLQWYELKGSLAGKGGTISNISLKAYPLDALGMPIAQLEDTDLGSLAPGATWSFTTVGAKTSFTKYHAYVDFIDGLAMRATPPTTRLEETDVERRASDAEKVARAELARSQAAR
jgi:hypothetical protein